MRDCDVIIESIVENLIEKGKIFNELYKSENKKYLIFTNTSSFSIFKLQRNCNLPIIGAHFFNSPLRSPIVETCFGGFSLHRTTEQDFRGIRLSECYC